MTKAATRAILRTDAPWGKKLRVLNALVGNAFPWSSPVWHYSKHLVRKFNAFHVTMVRRVLKFRRHTGEPWLDFEIRTRKLAKQVLHEQGFDLWGLCYLKRFWTYAGHVARGDVRTNVASNALYTLTLTGGEGSVIMSDTLDVSHPQALIGSLMHLFILLLDNLGR